MLISHFQIFSVVGGYFLCLRTAIHTPNPTLQGSRLEHKRRGFFPGAHAAAVQAFYSALVEAAFADARGLLGQFWEVGL